MKRTFTRIGQRQVINTVEDWAQASWNHWQQAMTTGWPGPMLGQRSVHSKIARLYAMHTRTHTRTHTCMHKEANTHARTHTHAHKLARNPVSTVLPAL